MTPAKRREREVKPRQYPSENKRPTISFRVRADMVDKLKASAEDRDLSLSEEVERSLNFKFDFARDAHDELVMRSFKTAFDMAEKLAGARWFESNDAAKLCHAAITKAADLLIVGLGDQEPVNGALDDAAVAISAVAVNQTAGFGMTDARRRYEEAVVSYKHFDRERYIMVKSLSEEDLPNDWATRPLTADELAAFQAGSTDHKGVQSPTPDNPAPKSRTAKAKTDE